jgi:hypothetical protein
MQTLLVLAIAVAFGLGLCAGPPHGSATDWFHYNNTWDNKVAMESCTCQYGVWSCVS